MYTIIVEEDGRNARINYHAGLSRLLSLPPEAVALLFGAGDAAGQISHLGGVDVFAFEAVAGTQIEVQFKDDAPGLARPVAEVYDPQGVMQSLLSPINERLIGQFNVIQTGTHVVAVYEHSHNHLVDYRLRVDCLGDSVACAPVVPLPTCNGLRATIIGTDRDSVLEGTDGDDVIVDLGGNAVIYGGAGNDTICGGSGDDILWGGLGNDVLLGEDGNDVLRGNDGDDLLLGGPGEDVLRGENGNDDLHGGDDWHRARR